MLLPHRPSAPWVPFGNKYWNIPVLLNGPCPIYFGDFTQSSREVHTSFYQGKPSFAWWLSRSKRLWGSGVSNEVQKEACFSLPAQSCCSLPPGPVFRSVHLPASCTHCWLFLWDVFSRLPPGPMYPKMCPLTLQNHITSSLGSNLLAPIIFDFFTYIFNPFTKQSV